MISDIQRRRVVYFEDDKAVSVGDVMEMAEAGEKTFELCPVCDSEIEIPVTGGYCSECGHWCLPCSMCDPRLHCDLGHEACPYHCFVPVSTIVQIQED